MQVIRQSQGQRMQQTMAMLALALLPSLLQATVTADCPPPSGVPGGDSAAHCSLDAGLSSSTPFLRLAIRVTHADCSPAAGADVTAALVDGNKCSGATSDDGAFVTSLSVGQVTWKIVSLVASQGDAEAKVHVFARHEGDKLVVKARDANHRVSSIETAGSAQGNYTAVISLVLDEEQAMVEDMEKATDGKRAWDDDSMAWLKRSQWGQDMSWIKRAHRPWGSKIALVEQAPGKRSETSDGEATAEEDESADSSAAHSSSSRDDVRDHVATRRKRWDDDNMQWIKRWQDDVDMAWLKRSSTDGDSGARRISEKRKPTQNTHGLRERPQGGRGRSRFH